MYKKNNCQNRKIQIQNIFLQKIQKDNFEYWKFQFPKFSGIQIPNVEFRIFLQEIQKENF